MCLVVNGFYFLVIMNNSVKNMGVKDFCDIVEII